MDTEQSNLLEDIAEMDETYIGGKPRKSNERTNEQNKTTYNKEGGERIKNSCRSSGKRGQGKS